MCLVPWVLLQPVHARHRCQFLPYHDYHLVHDPNHTCYGCICLFVQEATAPAEKVLSNQRYKQLDALISRAGMYTQFLTEQMKSYQAPAAGSQQQSEEEAEAPAVGKGKRKRGEKKEQASKKAKTDMAGVVAKGEAAAAAAAGVGDAAGTLLEKQKVQGCEDLACTHYLQHNNCLPQTTQRIAVAQVAPLSSPLVAVNNQPSLPCVYRH